MARVALKAGELAPALASPRSGLSSSTTTLVPPAPTVDASSLVGRMRAVLKRHQCGEEEEAVSLCLRQANAAAALQISAVGVAAAPGAAAAAGASAGGCELVIETFRFCRLHTQQHNYPAAPAFLC